MMERVICLVIGYLFGLFQTAYFYGKAHGIDIRQHGSGNAGTTNTLRVLGTKAGLIVLAGDCLKCMAAVWIVRLIFGRTHGDIIYLLCLYAGAGAILGDSRHCRIDFIFSSLFYCHGGGRIFWHFLYHSYGISGVASGVCGLCY